MKNNDALKKHHFWILFGVVPLFSLIGVQCISSNVGGAIADKDKKIDEAKKKIASKTNPKPKSLITEADALIEKVGNKSGGLHKENWDRQKALFTWPNSDLLKDIERKGPKFGEPLPYTGGQFDEFRKAEVYEYEFSSVPKKGNAPPGSGTGMADRVAPTQFKGGSWQNVLRHVNVFPDVNITNDQVWLMMEDIWVQRSLLSAIRSVNEEMATFRRAIVNAKGEALDDPTYDEQGYKVAASKDQAGNPARVPTPDKEKLKALFHNRTWSIELEVLTEGDSRRLAGTLTNQSDRLQLMGAGNRMTLHVWFTHSPTEQPMVFRFGGEFLPGKGVMKRGNEGRETPANVTQSDPQNQDHYLPTGKPVTEIVRVEQVFDVRTVPVKRIDALVMGKTDSRIGDDKPLALPAFIKEAEPAEAAAAPGGLPGRGPVGNAPPAGTTPPAGGKPQGGPGGGQQGAQGQSAGGGTIAAVIDGNKRRYLPDGVTDQVRRMPVGIVVVVDQAYMQDVLLAFANSPLRFQITQVSWTRFRGSDLATGSSGGSAGRFGGSGIIEGSGKNNVTGPGDPDAIRRPPGGGRAPGRTGPGVPPGGFPGPGRPPGGPPGVGGPPGGFSGGFDPNAAPSIASESQITAGLVELSIYGVVSLYEKYTEPGAPGAPAANAPAANAPAPGAPGVPAPPAAPGTPPGPPMNTTAPPAKKRRRVRA